MMDPVGTFVLSPRGLGYRSATVDASVHKAGLTTFLFNQHGMHGNGPMSTIPSLPVLYGMDQLTDAQLDGHVALHLQDYGGVYAYTGSKAERQKAVKLFKADFAQMHGRDLPVGLPNNRSNGIFRSNGIGHGKGATFLRQLPGALRLWDSLCRTQGRPTVTDGPDGYVCSWDGVFYTNVDHPYEGLKPHSDSNETDPGMWQGITCLQPALGKQRVSATNSAVWAPPRRITAALPSSGAIPPWL